MLRKVLTLYRGFRYNQFRNNQVLLYSSSYFGKIKDEESLSDDNIEPEFEPSEDGEDNADDDFFY